MREDLTQLEQEARHATSVLTGKTVAAILRPRDKEAIVQFTDGTRLYIDAKVEGVVVSISGEG